MLVKKSIKTPIYNTWHSLIQRCYDPIKQKTCPTYIGCTVCEEWHCFQNFASFCKENNPFKFDLDKDLLIKGNRIYSPETCCFIPNIINNSLIKMNRINYNNLKGLVTKQGKYRSYIYKNGKFKHLGNFKTSEEAFNCYKLAKEEHLKTLAEEWKDKIAENVYNALVNYEVII